MRAAELAVGGDLALRRGHRRDVARGIDRQRAHDLLRPAGAAEAHRLRRVDARALVVEEPQQQLLGADMRPDQLGRLDGLEQHHRPAPVVGIGAVDEVLGRQQPAGAGRLRPGVGRGLGHVLQEHAAAAPVRRAARLDGLAHRDGEAGRQLLGLREVGLGAIGERGAGDRGHALVRGRPLPLVDQDREDPLADQVERPRHLGRQRRGVVAGIGAHPRRLALLGRAEIVGGDQPHRPVAPDLQAELPLEPDRLADQRGDQRRLRHQGRDRGRVVVLAENRLQHRVQPADPAADVGAVELKGQDGVVPGDAAGKGHEGLP